MYDTKFIKYHMSFVFRILKHAIRYVQLYRSRRESEEKYGLFRKSLFYLYGSFGSFIRIIKIKIRLKVIYYFS